jgi:hypothetical protein
LQEFDGNLAEAKKQLVGYLQINCHMIFDIKMEGLACKARYVAGGHTTKTPKSLTFASVVTRESVQIGFLIAALNNFAGNGGRHWQRVLECRLPRENIFCCQA